VPQGEVWRYQVGGVQARVMVLVSAQAVLDSTACRSATVALRPCDVREQRGDPCHAGGQRGETLAHLPSQLPDLPSPLSHVLPEAVISRPCSSWISRRALRPSVWARSSARTSDTSRSAPAASTRAAAALELVRAACSWSRATSRSTMARRVSMSSESGTAVILLLVRPDASTRRTNRRIAWSMFHPLQRHGLVDTASSGAVGSPGCPIDHSPVVTCKSRPA
jgi:hypothetical protein